MKKLTMLAAVLAMVLAMAVPALAQNSAQTIADQFLAGDTDVSSESNAEQGDFAQGFDQTQVIDNSGGGIVVAPQIGAQTGAQLQIPISASVNAQQVPISAAADIDALIELILGL